MARGRPREFDIDDALDAAMLAFWHHGYQGTSLDDLTAAMGINRPSLYATFGDKEQLFLRAIDRYGAQYGARAAAALTTEHDARKAVQAFFDVVVGQLSDTTLPVGCLRVNSTLASSEVSAAINLKLIEHQVHLEATLQDRLQRAQTEGQIPPGEDVQALARFFAGVVDGMVVLARIHQDTQILRQMVSTALRVWPA